jgi:hypothetical protein
MFSHRHQCTHGVLFYRDGAMLRERTSGYIATALRAGQPGLVIARPDLLREVTIDLHRQHVQGAPFGPERGEFVALDADATLRRISVRDKPKAALFDQVIGAPVARLAAGGKRVAAYGEMVGILCERGQYADAVQLEAMWNALLAGVDANLYCAYAAPLFDRPGSADFRRQIVEAHTELVEEGAMLQA